MLGYIILVVFLGVFVFGALRLAPLYLNYMKVVGVVDGIFNEFDGKRLRVLRFELPSRVVLTSRAYLSSLSAT